MIDRTVIYKALAQHLYNNFSVSSAIAWENVSFKKQGKTVWLEEEFMPNDSDQATLGSAGTIHDYGMYQITVNTSTGIGTVTANNYIKELTLLYKAGLTLTVDGYDIHITGSTPAKGIEFEGWWSTPLTIYWSCYMTIN